MRNVFVLVLLFCGSLILSAQNKSSQFEQDLELIGMTFSSSDRYNVSDNLELVYITDDKNCPLRRLKMVHAILENRDGQCDIFVYISGANGLRYGGLVKTNKGLFGEISSLTYNRIKSNFQYSRPNSSASEQDIEDLKMMMTFYPHDTARSLFNADYMMVYPFNMEGKKYQDKFTRTRVIVTGKDGLDVFLYFAMTDEGIKNFDKYLMDFKGVFLFSK
mgnify:FL=1